MQTRRASKAAVAAAAALSCSKRTRISNALAVTPSPKKPKTCRSSSSSSTPRVECCSSEGDIRNELRSLVLSRIDSIDECSSDAKNIPVTLGGWCLLDGLTHCAIASNGVLLPLIKEHGPPPFYLDHIESKTNSEFGSYANGNGDSTNDSSGDCHSFRSLCRIVSGQQLAGNAAKTIWRRLLHVVGATEENTTNLTPREILSIAENGDIEADLRAPAGLSKAKCNCIIAIAERFREGTLSDNFLFSGSGEANDQEVRQRLLEIKGLGPWSVDMFLLFTCHRSDILPLGDLAFRNGTRNLWGLRGQAKGGGLCQKKDKKIMEEYHQAFAPYRSISSYYMYKCSGMKG